MRKFSRLLFLSDEVQDAKISKNSNRNIRDLVLGIIGLTVYGLQVYKDTSSTFEHISKPVDRKTKGVQKLSTLKKRTFFHLVTRN